MKLTAEESLILINLLEHEINYYDEFSEEEEDKKYTAKLQVIQNKIKRSL